MAAQSTIQSSEAGSARREIPSPRFPTAAALVAISLAIVAIISTGIWWRLYLWYGLRQNMPKIHYSFEQSQNWFDSPTLRQALLFFLILAALYAAAIVVIQTSAQLNGWAKAAIVIFVPGPGILNVLLYPVGALDIFNYLIELKLTYHYGQNPYLVTFHEYVSDSWALPAFLTDIHLFYGPAWLMLTGIPAKLAGFSDVARAATALKLFNLLIVAITAAVIAWRHRDPRTRWLAIVLFAANPLVLFEGVANGHNDVLLAAFIASAMVALERKSPVAGPLLALSALVKLYTVALLPIFIVVALKEHWGWRRIAMTAALTGVAVAATVTPYWGAGKLVDGLRAGLEESQEMDHVSPLSLVRQEIQHREAERRPDTAFALSRPSFEIIPEATQTAIERWFMTIFIVGTIIIAGSVWRGRPPALAAAETLLLLFLCLTNLYAWYLIPVFALLALHPDRRARGYAIVATGLGLAYYPLYVFAHYNSGWSRFHIHQFLAIFLTVPIVGYLFARLFPWRLFRSSDA